MFEHLRLARYFAELDQFISMRAALLSAWREHPCPQLAARLREPPIAPHIPQLRSHILAHDGRRLENLLDDIRRYARDPRLTPLLLDLAANPAVRGPLKPRHLCELWTSNGDPTGNEQMVAFGAEPLAYAPLDDETHTAVERVLGDIPLLLQVEAVYRAPEAMSPRQVLADVLLTAGDPWGELIALQIAKPDSIDDTVLRLNLSRRLAEPFGYEVSILELDRGFPNRVRAPAFKPLRTTAAWATVEELRFDRDQQSVPEPAAQWAMAQFLMHPALTGVTTVWDVPAVVLPLLEPPSCHVKRFAFSVASQLRMGTVIPALERLPSVHHVELVDPSFQGLEAVLRSTVLDQAELTAQGFGWKLRWSDADATLDLVLPPDEEWLSLFDALPRARRTRLQVIWQSEPNAVEPLRRYFRELTITPASSDPAA